MKRISMQAGGAALLALATFLTLGFAALPARAQSANDQWYQRDDSRDPSNGYDRNDAGYGWNQSDRDRGGNFRYRRDDRGWDDGRGNDRRWRNQFDDRRGYGDWDRGGACRGRSHQRYSRYGYGGGRRSCGNAYRDYGSRYDGYDRGGWDGCR